MISYGIILRGRTLCGLAFMVFTTSSFCTPTCTGTAIKCAAQLTQATCVDGYAATLNTPINSQTSDPTAFNCEWTAAGSCIVSTTACNVIPSRE